MDDPADPLDTLAHAFHLQASSCERAGSPLYAALLRGLERDVRGHGLTAELLLGVSDRPVHDAIPLRHLATAHRLALQGRAPELARLLPSCGGRWSIDASSDDLVEAVQSTVRTFPDEFEAGARRQVQTNEVGRAAVLAGGFAHLTARFGLPLRSWELGGSAGLLSHWMHYRYDTAEHRYGDPHSPVVFDPTWYDVAPPDDGAAVTVVDRRSCDVAPLDLADLDQRTTMLSFLWPDQSERRARMLAAIDVAVAHPLHVDQADAGAWLERQFAEASRSGTTTVVFHSIVWQYLPQATRERVRGALSAAGSAASTDAPVAWLRMEPAGAAHADLRLTTWPHGDEHVLAHVGYHGAPVRWLGQ